MRERSRSIVICLTAAMLLFVYSWNIAYGMPSGASKEMSVIGDGTEDRNSRIAVKASSSEIPAITGIPIPKFPAFPVETSGREREQEANASAGPEIIGSSEGQRNLASVSELRRMPMRDFMLRNDLITKAELYVNDYPYPPGSIITRGSPLRLKLSFSLPDEPEKKVRKGDTSVISIPKELMLLEDLHFPVKDETENVIAHAVLDKGEKTVRLTYTEYVETHSEVKGTLFVKVRMDTDVVKSKGEYELRIAAGENSVTIGRIQYKPANDSREEWLTAWGDFDRSKNPDGKIYVISYAIRVNAHGDSYSGLTLTDALQDPGMSYIQDSFQIERGEYILNEEGSLRLQESSRQTLTKEERASILEFGKKEETEAFSIRFGAVSGEGYLLRYDVLLNSPAKPNQIFRNRLVLSDEGKTINKELLLPVMNRATGGEAEGHQYEIRIRKTDAESHGKLLSGAVFEVLRDSDGKKAGEIVTDETGHGALKGLLQENYTIREIKAPKGYLPSEEILFVRTSDFGDDKTVLLELVNRKKPNPGGGEGGTGGSETGDGGASPGGNAEEHPIPIMLPEPQREENPEISDSVPMEKRPVSIQALKNADRTPPISRRMETGDSSSLPQWFWPLLRTASGFICDIESA